MNYCMQCGSEVVLRVPAGDDRERYTCTRCETIHYQNPKVVAGTIPVCEGKIVLCRRAIEPQYGLWTLPAGYLENGESVLDCAVRESWEEAGLRLHALSPYALCNLTFIHQIYFFYRAMLSAPDYSPGSESLEVNLFSPEEIPWTRLAFTVVEEVLVNYCRDRETGDFPFRVLDVTRKMKK